jgi:hypothetical protein
MRHVLQEQMTCLFGILEGRGAITFSDISWAAVPGFDTTPGNDGRGNKSRPEIYQPPQRRDASTPPG